MAVLFFDSFDHYTHQGGYVYEELAREYSLPDIEAYKNLINGPKLFDGRNSSCSLLLNGFYSPPTYTSNTYLDKNLYYNIERNSAYYLIIGCQIKKYKTGDNTLIGFKNNSGIHRGIKLTGNNLYVTSKTNEYGPYAIPDDNQWHHIELKIQISNPELNWVLKIDGTTTHNVAAEELVSISSNETLSRIFGIGKESTSTVSNDSGWLIDDLYLIDNKGTVFNDFIGPLVRIETILPFKDQTMNMIKTDNVSNGAQSQDNNPHNETQYVYTNSDNVTALYDFNNLNYIKEVGAIKPVILSGDTDNYYNSYTWINDETSHSCFRMLTNSVEFGPKYKTEGELNFEKPSGVFEKRGNLNSHIFNYNPSNNSNWTVTDTNNLQLGKTTKSYSIDITHVDAKFGQSIIFPIKDVNKLNTGYTALLITKRQNVFPNIDLNLWEEVDSAVIGSNYYKIHKRILTGIEDENMFAAKTTETGHDAAILFITSANKIVLSETASAMSSNSESFGILHYTFNNPKCYVIRHLRIVLGNGNPVSITNASAWSSINGYNGSSNGMAFFQKNTEFTSQTYDTATYFYSDSMNISTPSTTFGILKFNFLLGI